MIQQQNIIPSPCLGRCSTTYGDNICRGCKRDWQEVIHWNTSDNQKKAAYWHKLADLCQQVCTKYLLIQNPQKLQAEIQSRKIKCYGTSHLMMAWLVFARCLSELSPSSLLADWGIQVQKDYEKLSMLELWHLMDKEIYAEAETLYLQAH